MSELRPNWVETFYMVSGTTTVVSKTGESWLVEYVADFSNYGDDCDVVRPALIGDEDWAAIVDDARDACYDLARAKVQEEIAAVRTVHACRESVADYLDGTEIDDPDESEIPLVEIDRLNRKHLGLDHPDRIAELAKYLGCPVVEAICLLREKGGA